MSRVPHRAAACRDGDAIWVEYGDPAQPRRIVIDGGPAPSYEKGLLARLQRLKKGDLIDLFVITHIDSDHIDGAVILLQHADEIGVRFGEILVQRVAAARAICAGHLQAAAGRVPRRADRQGRPARQVEHPARKARPSSCPRRGRRRKRHLPDNARLTLLSPGLAQIKRLRARWSSAMRGFCGDTAEALRRLDARAEYRPPALQPVFGGGTSPGRRPVRGERVQHRLPARARRRRLRVRGRCVPTRARRLAAAAVRGAGPGAGRADPAGRLQALAPRRPGQRQRRPGFGGGVFAVARVDQRRRASPEVGTRQTLIAKHAPGSEFFCNYKSDITVRFADTSSSPAWHTHYPGEGVPAGETGGIVLDLLPVKETKPASPVEENAAGQKGTGKRQRRASAGRRRARRNGKG